MVYVDQHVIVLQISEAKRANFRFVEVMFFAIMVFVGVTTMKSVNVEKRMEKPNIMVKVVICLLHAMDTHVKMVEYVQETLNQIILRPVS